MSRDQAQSSTSGSTAGAASSQHRIQFFHHLYMESSGAPSMPWDNWLRLFRLFVIGSSLTGATEQLKLAVLFGSLGADAARIASDMTDDTTTYDETLKRLTERFGERQSVIFARTKFHRRSQQSGEDILAYVTELRRLASYCKFAGNELESVRDRLVAGCLDDKIRERLFQEPETLSLDNAVILAQTVERATSESRRIGSSRPDRAPAELLKVNHERHHSPRRHERSPSQGSSRSPSSNRAASQHRSSFRSGCYRCGGSHPRGVRCSAEKATCLQCGRLGHYAKVCQGGRYPSKQPRGGHRPDNRVIHSIHIATVGGDTSTDRNSYATVKLAGISTRLLIDTGAQASVIRGACKRCELLTANCELRTPKLLNQILQI